MCKEKKDCSCSCKKKKTISETTKKELLKKHTLIQEAILSMYDTCSKKNVFDEKILSVLEETYKNIDTNIMVLLTDKNE